MMVLASLGFAGDWAEAKPDAVNNVAKRAKWGQQRERRMEAPELEMDSYDNGKRA
jgi:hypothetical protein